MPINNISIVAYTVKVKAQFKSLGVVGLKL